MIEATFYTLESSSDMILRCLLCPHRCLIKLNQTGFCHTRKNIGGKLYAMNYGKVVAAQPDPIEKKPLYHFLPNHHSYSIASAGCNFRCSNCQNSSISQQDINKMTLGDTTPKEVIAAAVYSACQSISFTYTEPTTFYEFIHNTAPLAHAHNLKNILVSNGYMSDQCIDGFLPLIDAVNIDLKAFTNAFYQTYCKATLPPILNTIKRFHTYGIHVEVTTLLIPDLNTGTSELTELCQFIHSLNPEIPWHISRFHPSYEMLNIPSTPTKLLLKAKKIGRLQGLQHIYIGNAPEISSPTVCPNCKTVLFKRHGFSTTPTHFHNGCCSHCNTPLFGTFS